MQLDLKTGSNFGLGLLLCFGPSLRLRSRLLFSFGSDFNFFFQPLFGFDQCLGFRLGLRFGLCPVLCLRLSRLFRLGPRFDFLPEFLFCFG